MSAPTLRKPCRLEINNSGAWKLLGTLDAADDEQVALVLDAAEQLVLTLHNKEDPKGCPTLRVSTNEALPVVLMRWAHGNGWRDVMLAKARA